MRLKTTITWLTIFLLTILVSPAGHAHAGRLQADPRQSSGVTAYDLIAAMNTLRMSYGLPALIEHPIVNAVAQSTAEIMAANRMSWHIGDVRGRIAAAGYGGSATVWATENFAVGSNMTIDQIMLAWSDYDHMRPAVIPSYCHVGAGVARSADGMVYYVLQAAYTSSSSCGEYAPVIEAPSQPGGTAVQPGTRPVSQWVVPVKIATPDAEGKIYHVVETGQSFWSIAVAYKITIRDLEIWNNLSRNQALQTGQRLFIPSSNTQGYATPTPVGMVVTSTPDAEGKIIHEVQAYHTLITIAQAYQVTVDEIIALNGIQKDWPLQIGQKLLIDPGWITPSPTPRPLTPIEKLTPASDGNYYHTVHSGETLSWIANLYNVPLADLMAWNGLNNASIIRPDQKLVLQVTPPATATRTPGPPTFTPTLTLTQPPPTVTRTPTRITLSPTATSTQEAQPGRAMGNNIFQIVLAIAGLIGLGLIARQVYETRAQAKHEKTQ